MRTISRLLELLLVLEVLHSEPLAGEVHRGRDGAQGEAGDGDKRGDVLGHIEVI